VKDTGFTPGSPAPEPLSQTHYSAVNMPMSPIPQNCHGVSFTHNSKTPEIISLQGEKAYSGSQCLGFQGTVVSLFIFGPVARQHNVVGRMSMRKTTQLMARIQTTEREEGAGVPLSPSGHSPNYLKLPNRPCLLKVPSPPKSTTLGNNPLTRRPLGDMLDPNCSLQRISIEAMMHAKFLVQYLPPCKCSVSDR
jgi:hypothetical protein